MDRQRSRSPKRQRSGSHERGHERASLSSTRRRSRSPEKGDDADIKGHYGKRSRSKSPAKDCSNNRDHKRTKHDGDRDHEKHGNRDGRHERDRDRHGRHEPTTGDPDRRDKGRDRKHDRDGDKEKDRESNKRHKHHHHHHEERRRPKAADFFYEERHDEKDAVVLPHGARALSTRNDLATFEPLFAHYLDLQKGLDMGALEQDEIRGRWKSFVGKWNRGELAEGWYDPAVFARLVAAANSVSSSSVPLPPGTNNMPPPGSDGRERPEPSPRQPGIEGILERSQHKPGESEDDDDDDYGPPPPPVSRTNGSQQQQQQFGAALPSVDDLRARDDLISEERQAARAAEIADLRFARKVDRLQQKERLDDLLPKAEAGSRERKLEKRKELNEKMRAFREPSPGGAEVPEGELLGGKDSLDDYKKMLAARQAKKTERQVRREEIQRARAAEREGRIRAYKLREEGTVEMLRELARRRFG